MVHMYESSETTMHLHELVVNRIAIVNQLLGSRYKFGSGAPLAVVSKGSRYLCRLNGCDLFAWDLRERSTVLEALACSDTLQNFLWLLGVGGV